MLDIKNSTNENYFITHLINKNLNHKLFDKPICSNLDKIKVNVDKIYKRIGIE